jgi:hypothetical protein
LLTYVLLPSNPVGTPSLGESGTISFVYVPEGNHRKRVPSIDSFQE